MRKFLLALVSFMILCCSCNLDKNRKLSDDEVKALAKAHNDSVMVALDSLYTVSIYVPPLYDKETFDSATTVSFYGLARQTQGELKLLVNSQLITTEIVNIIQSNAKDNSDILVLMDKTGSMLDDLINVKKGLNQVIAALHKYNNIRLGIALYGDKNVDGADWFSFKDFETDYAKATAFINDIEVTGGGDYPESVYEGFFKSCEQNFWRSGTKRMIILIGDAPPLEKPLSDHTISDVIKKATEDKITMNFYPIVVAPDKGIENTAVKEEKTYEKVTVITALYPNPSPGLINVRFKTDDKYSIEIFNSSGVMVLSDNASGTQWRKDISRFSNGAYILRAIKADKQYETIKLSFTNNKMIHYQNNKAL